MQLRRFRGAGQDVPRRLGRGVRREGRLRHVHGEGDLRPAGRGARHAARPYGRGGAPDARRDPHLRRGPQDHRPHHDRRVWHRRVRGHGRQVRDRALDAHPGRGVARARVPLLRPDRLRAHAGRVDLAVGRDDGHAHGRKARQGARRPHAVDLQHARRDDSARVRRRALHARRPGDRGRLDEGVPRADHGLLHPRPLPRAAARRHVRRRRGQGHGRAAGDAGQDRGGARPPRAHPRDRPLHGRHPLGAVPRPQRRLPDRDGGCAQAQGARLHPRRGLRRR